MLGPLIEDLSKDIGGKAKVIKVNVDENPEIAGTYCITSIPTVLIFDKGELKTLILGVQPKSKYLSELGIE